MADGWLMGDGCWVMADTYGSSSLAQLLGQLLWHKATGRVEGRPTRRAPPTPRETPQMLIQGAVSSGLAAGTAVTSGRAQLPPSLVEGGHGGQDGDGEAEEEAAALGSVQGGREEEAIEWLPLDLTDGW